MRWSIGWSRPSLLRQPEPVRVINVPKVVITGMGVVSPCGNSPDELFENLVADLLFHLRRARDVGCDQHQRHALAEIVLRDGTIVYQGDDAVLVVVLVGRRCGCRGWR